MGQIRKIQKAVGFKGAKHPDPNRRLCPLDRRWGSAASYRLALLVCNRIQTLCSSKLTRKKRRVKTCK